MRRIPFAIGIAVLLAASAASACTSSAGTPSASPTGTPWGPPTGSAILTVTGSGTLDCRVPHACIAFFLIKPADWDGHWRAQESDPSFSMEYTYESGSTPLTTISRVSGAAQRIPTSLAPGRYRLAGARADTSDVPSGGPGYEPYFSDDVMCRADLTVETSTRRVDVTVAFDHTDCEIAISLDSPAPTA
ncbi:MAG: hypothetical protein ABSB75_03165 [Candidatus Limnocylindrales bacterium]